MGKAAGTTVFVEHLVQEQKKLGHAAFVWENEFPVSPDVQVLHLHGLWSPFLHRVARWARHNHVPFVWSPHGMLTPWALENKWYKKLPALALYQWRDLRAAAVLHATAPSEVADIRRLGLRNPVVEAPLGVDLPDVREKGLRVQGALRTLLFVSRVQRKKGLPNLISAWSRLPQEFRTNWHIRIVGPDQEGHMAELKAQATALKVLDNITFVGPKFGADLANEYSAADVFVLPTHSENFGSVVLEALAYGVPTIATKGAPWAELESERCGLWVEQGVEPLRTALQKMMELSDAERAEMGARGRRLAATRYQWPAVAETLLACYKAVVG